MQCEACGHSNIDGARFCAKCGAIMPIEEKGSDPMIGQLVGGRFRVTGVLGEGGMGIVYVGEQQMGSTVRKVAIKTLHQHLSKDPSVLARFHRECGTIAQLEHPNTIKVYDFGSTGDGTLYIAMEFVAGRPLAEIIRTEGALAPDRVIQIMRQICGALDEAHQTGIIHRDLKPENVILTKRAGETDFVKLLDFGIAARSESADAQKEQKLTQQGMVLGTPPYMSPEQFTGKALDVRSDIYSLGVMAYEMLTGRLPFDADTPWQWATQHMTAQPIPFETSAPARNIPSGLRQAILRSLAKEREQRQSSAREFFSELSDGSRITVDSPPPAGALKSGTVGMDALPDFGNARLPVTPVNVPAMRTPTVQGGGTPAGMAMPAPPNVPVVPNYSANRPKQGGGKGMIVGLGGVGAVLLIAIVVVAARSLKNGDDEPITIPTSTPGTASPTGPVEIKPTETAPTTLAPPPQVPGQPANTPSGGRAATNPNPNPNPGSTPRPPQQGSSQQGSAQPSQPGPAQPSQPGGGSCDACMAAANSGNIGAAVAAANSCGDAGKKAACVSTIKRSGGAAARAAARNGQCGPARTIVAAAAKVGADISGALKGTSCQ
jgi:serine/threonine-protein kinase